MRILRFSCFIFAALLAFFAERDVCGQWVNVAPNIVSPKSNEGFGDGGTTWQQISPFSFPGNDGLQIRKKNNAIYSLEAEKGHIYYSQDGGVSWIQTPGIFEVDCFQFALDPCNDNALYVINEGDVYP